MYIIYGHSTHIVQCVCVTVLMSNWVQQSVVAVD